MDHAANHQHDELSPGRVAGQTQHAAGHDRHEGHSVAMFRGKFRLSLALTIPDRPAQARGRRLDRLHDPVHPGPTCEGSSR